MRSGDGIGPNIGWMAAAGAAQNQAVHRMLVPLRFTTIGDLLVSCVMSRRVVIAIVSVLLLAGAGLFVLVPLLAAPRATALLTFTGHTNAVFQPRGKRPAPSETCGTFRLTNATTARFNYYAESIETWTPAGWQFATLRCTPTNWYRFGTSLDPGEACVFHVPAPDAERWRIRVTCTEKATGLQGIKDRIADYRANPRPGEDGTRIERFNGFTYQIVSPEVRR
jgi:hypothetical protein